MEEVTEDYQNLCTKIKVVHMNVHSSTLTISVSAKSLILSLHTVICIRQNICVVLICLFQLQIVHWV